MPYPENRPRRLRRSDSLRRMVRETVLSVNDLIYPLFVIEGENRKDDIAAMPGVSRFSVDLVVAEAREAYELGIPAVLLFGIPNEAEKDPRGKSAYSSDAVVSRAVRAIKEALPELTVITDVCLCAYTDHGHCGVVHKGEIDNDETLDLLCRMALSHARAGADVIAPSDMMDGRVGAIRESLDEEGFEGTAILAYSAKYASAFYGPFREAAQSAPSFGDRRAYQMDPANSDEAITEVSLDVDEGADMVMVKPALAYLDVIRRVREEFDLPVVAYNVSGEYSMVKAAAANGWLDESLLMMEILTAIKRAGADLIITYFAKDAAKRIR